MQPDFGSVFCRVHSSPHVGQAPSGTALNRAVNAKHAGQDSPASKGRGKGGLQQTGTDFTTPIPTFSPMKGEGALDSLSPCGRGLG